MQAAIRNTRTVVLLTALFFLTAMFLVKHAPESPPTSDLFQAASESTVVHTVSASKTCQQFVSCEVPPLFKDSLQASANDLFRTASFLERDRKRRSISPEARLPPPRV